MPPAKTTAARIFHLPALDGVRGLAVLMVIAYHSMHAVTPTGGVETKVATLIGMLWCGVDLFFVLSGFLITRILLATLDSPRYFRSFYARRTLRIFPLYYGFLTVLFVVLPALAWAIGGGLAELLSTGAYRRLADNQLWLWTYTHNFLQARGPSQLPGLGHFWSLAIEEQFYLVWPALVWVAARSVGGPRRVAALCLAIALAAPIARAALLAKGADPWAVFHWTFTRCDGLAWGALAAAIDGDEKLRLLGQRLARGGLWIAIGGWIACGFFAGGWDKIAPAIQTAGYTLAAMGFACWVFRLATSNPGHASTWLTTPWLQSLGRVSYAMYVFHWPLCRGFERWLADPAWPPLVTATLEFLSVLAASFPLAWLSWHLWEKHWLRLKAWFPY